MNKPEQHYDGKLQLNGVTSDDFLKTANQLSIAVYATLKRIQEHYYPWGIPEIDELEATLVAKGLLEDRQSPGGNIKNSR